MTTLPTTPTRELGGMSAEPLPVQQVVKPLINSLIVDVFYKAIESYGDNKTSWREDFRHGLEQVAPLIVARSTLTTENARLAERVKVLEGALKPFADAAENWSDDVDDDEGVITWPYEEDYGGDHEHEFTVADLRRARSALSHKDGE